MVLTYPGAGPGAGSGLAPDNRRDRRNSGGQLRVCWEPTRTRKAGGRSAQPVPTLPGSTACGVGWQRVPIYRFGIAPNKLMDYMMARCVVLHSVEAGNDPVAEAGCGITVPPADPPAIAAGLRELARLDAATRERMGEAGRQFVLANHTYPVLAQRFIESCS